MTYRLIGVNHKTAPVEVRERLAVPDSHLPEALRRLAEHALVDEAFVLSTCNRVELLVSHAAPSAPDLRLFLKDFFRLDPDTLAPHLYEFAGDDVIRHLFRVAASLDSMIVGEPQI